MTGPNHSVATCNGIAAKRLNESVAPSGWHLMACSAVLTKCYICYHLKDGLDGYIDEVGEASVPGEWTLAPIQGWWSVGGKLDTTCPQLWLQGLQHSLVVR